MLRVLGNLGAECLYCTVVVHKKRCFVKRGFLSLVIFLWCLFGQDMLMMATLLSKVQLLRDLKSLQMEAKAEEQKRQESLMQSNSKVCVCVCKNCELKLTRVSLFFFCLSPGDGEWIGLGGGRSRFHRFCRHSCVRIVAIEICLDGGIVVPPSPLPCLPRPFPYSLLCASPPHPPTYPFYLSLCVVLAAAEIHGQARKHRCRPRAPRPAPAAVVARSLEDAEIVAAGGADEAAVGPVSARGWGRRQREGQGPKGGTEQAYG